MNLKLKLRIIEKFGTQADFAQKENIPAPVVSEVIRGRRKLKGEDQTLWAKKLGCKPEDIFSERVGNEI